MRESTYSLEVVSGVVTRHLTERHEYGTTIHAPEPLGFAGPGLTGDTNLAEIDHEPMLPGAVGVIFGKTGERPAQIRVWNRLTYDAKKPAVWVDLPQPAKKK